MIDQSLPSVLTHPRQLLLQLGGVERTAIMFFLKKKPVSWRPLKLSRALLFTQWHVCAVVCPIVRVRERKRERDNRADMIDAAGVNRSHRLLKY